MLRTWLNLIFMLLCFGVGAMTRLGWFGTLFFLLPLGLSYFYLRSLRPALLQNAATIEANPAPPVPFLRHKAYRLFRYVCCFSDLWAAISLVGLTHAWIVEAPHPLPWLRFAHLVVGCAWAVTAALKARTELRELRRELRRFDHSVQVQPTPQAQHYGPQ
jgi:hypothetical protein